MGVIQCGSFVGNTTVTIGWEPQYIMIKRTDSTGDWITIDSMRGCSVGGIDAILNPNLSNAENVSNDYIDFTATGFISKNLTGTYIYMVIRRPNKVPTSGTEVYNAIARTGTGAVATVSGVGFAPDLAMIVRRAIGGSHSVIDRLRGRDLALYSATTDAEAAQSVGVDSFNMDGVTLGTASPVNANTATLINHFFRRAKGFMDIVCYTGTGVARTVNHNLGVVPELMIVKSRSALGVWAVGVPFISADARLYLHTNGAINLTATTLWNSTLPTDTVFTIGTDADTNFSGRTFIAYLFATLAGISKVGSYTGNGSSQTINCGFTTGARFILVKRTDSTGDWYLWDSVRGIVAANDPHLSLNTTAAEVTTDDSIDPAVEGFVCNQNTATNINVLNGTYIYLAIA